MTKFELTMAILGGVGLIGIFVLVGLDKQVDLLLPLVTTIIGWLIGKKQWVESAAGAIFKKK